MTRRLGITILTALLFVVVGVFQLNAQNVFKVLAVRGTVTVAGKPATLGLQLTTKQKIAVSKGAYISLAHVNGRTIEIKKDGSYAVSDLDKKASTKTKSSTSKFASYVVSELTEVKEPVSFSDDRRTKMKTTGSVERAMGDDVSIWDSVLSVVGGPGELQALAAVQKGAVNSGQDLVVISPRHTRILGDSIAFIWHSTPKTQSFRIIVTDRTNNVVYDGAVTDTMVVVSVAKLGIKSGSLHYWHVESASDKSFHSDDYALWRLDGEERQSVEATLAEVNSDITESDAAIGQLILGAAFEDMGLNADAQNAYSKAVAIAPDIQNYKRMYADFLRRQGLAYDAYVAYK